MKRKVTKAIVKALKKMDTAMEETTLSAVVDAVVAVFEKENPTKTAVRYIGKRDTYSDGLFSTGIWNQGESKMVPKDIAAKMVVHADVYEPGDAKDTGEVIEEKEPEDNSETEKAEDASNAINNMQEIDDIKLFVSNNLHGQQIEIDGRSGIEKYRQEAIRLVDTYGMP